MFKKREKREPILKETAEELGIPYSDLYHVYREEEEAGALKYDALYKAVTYAYNGGSENGEQEV